MSNFKFLLPNQMKDFGFDLIPAENNSMGYFKYQNNGTVQYNKDYNKDFPEPRGKIIIFVNMHYSDNTPFIGIEQDGGTRNVYNGIVPSQLFFETLLTSIR